MFLITTDPNNQQIGKETAACAKYDSVKAYVNTVAPHADNKIVYVWRLVEKHYVDYNISTEIFTVNEKGEVLPK